MKAKDIIITFSLILLCGAQAFSQQEAITPSNKQVILFDDGTWLYADSVPFYNIKPIPLSKLEIPKISAKEIVITHSGFSLLYSEQHEQASWVAYELTSEKTVKVFERTDKFLPDPNVKSKTANDKDYSGSGYDRGHLAPASDMGWSQTSMKESFYYSNISPQNPSFNRGIWRSLEEIIRTWAVENKSVYVVTGPILSENLLTIGSNKASVPDYYYKIVLDYTEPSIKSIAFILPNAQSSEPLEYFAVTIDSAEKLTGIDFFPLLPDDQENIIEGTLCIKCWSWKNAFSKNEDEQNKLSTSVQCKGITKAGERCKKKTLSASGYCNLHENQSSGSNSEIQSEKKVSTDKATSTTKSGQTIYTGPRGGQYHYSKSGKKVYHKRKK